MFTELLPMRVVIATRDRTAALRRTLESLGRQSAQPVELTIVDASTDGSTRSLCVDEIVPNLISTVSWCQADVVGAAIQRNQGVRSCSHPVIAFMDDDILFEPECFRRLWRALQSHDRIGGVSAMITNQRYQAPGNISRFVFCLMAGRREKSYAGRVLGPAVNLLPEDREELPEIVPVEWLNTTCVFYRAEALPNPPFPDHFTDYSLMEDLALSLIVSRQWDLANARTARIIHDSQQGTHKANAVQVSEMQLINRHFIMTRILGRDRFQDYLKLAIFEAFSLASTLHSTDGHSMFVPSLAGRLAALRRMWTC